MAIDTRNPYVGLRPFDALDAPYFFGRERQIAEILQLLGTSRFVGVVGSSGSGKSSLIRAGVIPAVLGGLMVHARANWKVATIRPGHAPLRNLAYGLLQLRGTATPDEPAVVALAASLTERGISAVDSLFATSPAASPNRLLLVDQFEEVFAYRGRDIERGTSSGGDPEQTAEEARRLQERLATQATRRAEAALFVELMLELASETRQLAYVTLTMRTDFLGDCDVFYRLPEQLNRGRYLVPRMNRDELRESIACPAEIARASVADNLVDHLLNTLGDRYDRLPVLQHALMCTWEHWDARGRRGDIELEDFLAIGGLEDALDFDANAILDMSPSSANEVRLLFRALVDTDPASRRVRRPTTMRDLEAVTGLPAKRIAAHVTRFSERNRHFLYRVTEGDDDRIDIAHESLIRQWNRLREWVDEERVARDTYLELVRDARAHGRNTKALLVGVDLEVALKWRASTPNLERWSSRYNESPGDFALATHYLTESQTVSDREANDRRQSTVRRYLALSALCLLLAFGFGIVVRANIRASQASARSKVVNSLAIARGLLPTDPTSAVALLGELTLSDSSTDLQLFQDALRSDFSTAVYEADTAAANWADFRRDGKEVVVAAGRVVRRFTVNDTGPADTLTLHNKLVRRVRYSPDARFVVTASLDSTARILDLAARTAIVLRMDAPVLDVAVSPASDRIATVSADGTLSVWRRDGSLLWSRTEHAGEVYGVEFSPDGQQLVTAPQDGLVRVWTVADSSSVIVGHHTQVVWSARFSPDGRRIVSASDDGTAEVCDIAMPRCESFAHPQAVYDASWSLHGDRIVTAGGDSTAHVWFIASKEHRLLRGLEHQLVSVRFGRGDTVVAGGARDGTVAVWNGLGGGRAAMLRGHRRSITMVQFDTTGMLLTASLDGTARRWRARGPLEPSIRGFHGASFDKPVNFPLHARRVGDVAFSPDGRRVATASDDYTAVVWNLLGAATPTTLRHADVVYRVRFSSDGRQLITASKDKTARLWSIGGDSLRTLVSPTNAEVLSAQFLPGDTAIVTSQADGGVYLWSALRNTPPRLLTKHASEVWTADVSPDGRLLATGSWDGRIRLTSLDDGRWTMRPLDSLPGKVHRVRFGPNGEWLVAAGDDGTVRIWNVRAQKLVWTFTGSAPMLDVAVSPDGSRIATTSRDRLVHLFRPFADSSDHLPLAKHDDVTWSVQFSPEGRRLLSHSLDGATYLWSLDSLTSPTRLDEKGSRVTVAALNGDGTRLVTGSEDGSVARHSVSLTEVRQIMNEATTYCLPVEFRVETLGETLDDAERAVTSCHIARKRPPSSVTGRGRRLWSGGTLKN